MRETCARRPYRETFVSTVSTDDVSTQLLPAESSPLSLDKITTLIIYRLNVGRVGGRTI